MDRRQVTSDHTCVPTLMTSLSSPALLALIGLDVVVPAQGVAQVGRGRRRDRLEDCDVCLGRDVSEHTKYNLN